MSDEIKTQAAEPEDNNNGGVPEPVGTGSGNPGQAPATIDGANPDEQHKPNNDNAYQSIIEQQNKQIQALLEHTEKQAEQIAQMVQNGAQFYQEQNTPPAPPKQQVQTLSDDDDLSLEALGREIGKR